MGQGHSRRWILAGLAAFAGQSAFANAPDRSLRPKARDAARARAIRSETAGEALVRASGLSGIVGYAVVDLRNGRVLEERASAAALPPASVAKAMTALYALEHLGRAHRFETRVIATGGISNGVVQGDLILAGGGDPTLDTDRLALLAQRLKANGIREVRGDFKVWGGALPRARVIDPGQPEHVGYNPSVSGLNLNFNRVHFEWRRADGNWAISMDARSNRYRPDVSVARMQIARRRVPIYTYEDSGRYDSWTVASGALGNGGARWLPVRKPEIYAGEVFQTFARSQGIVLGAPKLQNRRPSGTNVARVESEPLEVLVRDMLKYSTNLTAEVLGLAASQASGANVSSLSGSGRAMAAWARQKYGMGRATKFVDHSGLGDASRVTAQDMAKALRAAASSQPIRALMKDIPIRDDNSRVVPNHPVQVRAKTGTLNFVSSLAGYATAEDGRPLAFAIFAADTSRRGALSREERERPQGARSYNGAAKALQQKLLRRWGRVHRAS